MVPGSPSSGRRENSAHGQTACQWDEAKGQERDSTGTGCAFVPIHGQRRFIPSEIKKKVYALEELT